MPVMNDISKGTELGYKSSNKFIFSPCVHCGELRWTMLLKGKPEHNGCNECANIGKGKGENNRMWKGGKFKDKNGYILVYTTHDDFFASMATRSKGANAAYALEHRLVMAKSLGRCLHSWEIVHHKNHIKDDNRLGNLQLVTDDRHKQITLLENRIATLEQRVTLLESENILLRVELGVKV